MVFVCAAVQANPADAALAGTVVQNNAAAAAGRAHASPMEQEGRERGAKCQRRLPKTRYGARSSL